MNEYFRLRAKGLSIPVYIGQETIPLSMSGLSPCVYRSGLTPCVYMSGFTLCVFNLDNHGWVEWICFVVLLAEPITV